MERWLHQHLFKVGWLLTHNYQTTTILYYTFFLPGVILHEIVYYLAAGIVNVRADRAIQWPEEQKVAELKLNFIQLERRAAPIRKAVITISPLLVGLGVIWIIANNVLDINAAVAIMSTGQLQDVSTGLQQLTSSPDFWLWFYIIFTISNTMFPIIPKDLQGWRPLILMTLIVTAVLITLGVGSEILSAVETPVMTFMSAAQTLLILMIVIDFCMVLLLGTVESLIERVTGHSATFKRGKLETRTREQVQEERRKAREAERRRQERRVAERQAAAANRLPPSIDMIRLPIPGAPGTDEQVSLPQIFGNVEPPSTLPEAPVPPETTPAPETGIRREPLFNPRQAVEREHYDQIDTSEPAPPSEPDFAKPSSDLFVSQQQESEKDNVLEDTAPVDDIEQQTAPLISPLISQSDPVDETPSVTPDKTPQLSHDPTPENAVASSASGDETASATPITDKDDDEAADDITGLFTPPVTRNRSSFDISPFSRSPASETSAQPDANTDHNSEDEMEETTAAEPLKFRPTAPSSPTNRADADRHDENDEEEQTQTSDTSDLGGEERRRRGNDDLSDLFSSLNPPDHAGSILSTQTEDESNEGDEDDSLLSKSQFKLGPVIRRPAAPASPRRPVFDLTASSKRDDEGSDDDDKDDPHEDDLEYEEIEDEYYDDDDSGYFRYDDDDD